MASKAGNLIGFAVLAGLISGCAGPQARRLRRFEATLNAHDSATLALKEWCTREGIADPSQIVAQKIPAPAITGEAYTAPDDLRRLLGLESSEQAVGYRHVRLVCGDTILSEAHNWYVPDRLTPAMNAELAATDRPFGAVAMPLRFRRERIATIRGASRDCPGDTILTHRALLRLPDGQPLALLIECYTSANLPRSRSTSSR